MSLEPGDSIELRHDGEFAGDAVVFEGDGLGNVILDTGAADGLTDRLIWARREHVRRVKDRLELDLADTAAVTFVLKAHE